MPAHTHSLQAKVSFENLWEIICCSCSWKEKCIITFYHTQLTFPGYILLPWISYIGVWSNLPLAEKWDIFSLINPFLLLVWSAMKKLQIFSFHCIFRKLLFSQLLWKWDFYDFVMSVMYLWTYTLPLLQFTHGKNADSELLLKYFLWRYFFINFGFTM